MNVLIVGYGSIGARHESILTSLGCQVSIASRRNIENKKIYHTVAEALYAGQFEYIVVANRTHEHADTLRSLQYLQYEGLLLLEKPLFHRMEHELAQLTMNNAFVAYNLRFHPVLQQLKQILSGRRATAVQIYVGQYLPDWRPEQDYRKGYSASREMGGGVLRDLSHELDYATWLFGDWTKLTSLGGKFSSLEIDSDDVYTILLETEECSNMTIQLNYLDRNVRRYMIIHLENQTIYADLINGSIAINQEKHTIEASKNSSYEEMHVSVLNGQTQHLCTYKEGLKTVEMIEAIEHANSTKTWVSHDG